MNKISHKIIEFAESIKDSSPKEALAAFFVGVKVAHKETMLLPVLEEMGFGDVMEDLPKSEPKENTSGSHISIHLSTGGDMFYTVDSSETKTYHKDFEGLMAELANKYCQDEIERMSLSELINSSREEDCGCSYNKFSSKKTKKKPKLNKPFRTPGGPKKFSVYVKNEKGNIVKVNFGDPNMDIKRDNPNRRKNFRARHNCDNPGPKTKARYWSCKMWSKPSVSDVLKK